jgi:hypothetical protein
VRSGKGSCARSVGASRNRPLKVERTRRKWLSNGAGLRREPEAVNSDAPSTGRGRAPPNRTNKGRLASRRNPLCRIQSGRQRSHCAFASLLLIGAKGLPASVGRAPTMTGRRRQAKAPSAFSFRTERAFYACHICTGNPYITGKCLIFESSAGVDERNRALANWASCLLARGRWCKRLNP